MTGQTFLDMLRSNRVSERKNILKMGHGYLSEYGKSENALKFYLHGLIGPADIV